MPLSAIASCAHQMLMLPARVPTRTSFFFWYFRGS